MRELSILTAVSECVNCPFRLLSLNAWTVKFDCCLWMHELSILAAVSEYMNCKFWLLSLNAWTVNFDCCLWMHELSILTAVSEYINCPFWLLSLNAWTVNFDCSLWMRELSILTAVSECMHCQFCCWLYVTVLTVKRTKYFWLFSPTQLFTQGQWWSIFLIHLWQTLKHTNPITFCLF